MIDIASNYILGGKMNTVSYLERAIELSEKLLIEIDKDGDKILLSIIIFANQLNGYLKGGLEVARLEEKRNG
jgi:hypothetical protein